MTSRFQNSTNLSSFILSSEGRQHAKTLSAWHILSVFNTDSHNIFFSFPRVDSKSKKQENTQQKDGKCWIMKDSMETLYCYMHNFTVLYTSTTSNIKLKRKAHTAICVTDCCRFFGSSSGISKHSWKWTRSCFHNSLIYQNCFLLLWIPPHTAFQTPLEWPNNPHHNITTTEAQIPRQRLIQTRQYTINTLISLCITAHRNHASLNRLPVMEIYITATRIIRVAS